MSDFDIMCDALGLIVTDEERDAIYNEEAYIHLDFGEDGVLLGWEVIYLLPRCY